MSLSCLPGGDVPGITVEDARCASISCAISSEERSEHRKPRSGRGGLFREAYPGMLFEAYTETLEPGLPFEVAVEI